MAQAWISTPRKRLMLAGLNVLARMLRPWLSGGVGPVDPRAVTRILVVELWNIGDVILAMPFLAQLRALFPGAAVTLLARPYAREVLEGTGLVDEFLEAELAWTDARLHYNPFAYDWIELRRAHRRLREREFDIAFQCRMHIRERFILAVSGARRRVGYAFGVGDGLLTDAIPVGDPGRHKTADWLRLLGPFGTPIGTIAPRLCVSQSERDWASQYFVGHGVSPSDVLIGVHPGASVSEKRWPLERFHLITESLSKRPGMRVVAFTEPGGYGASLGEIPGVIGAKVGLRELIALIDRCDLLVCNDSGPMHIAGALGVPTVAIFGSRVWEWFAPLGDGHQALIAGTEMEGPANGEPSAPSHDVSTIPIARVLSAVERVLNTIVAGAQTRPTG